MLEDSLLEDSLVDDESFDVDDESDSLDESTAVVSGVGIVDDESLDALPELVLPLSLPWLEESPTPSATAPTSLRPQAVAAKSTSEAAVAQPRRLGKRWPMNGHLGGEGRTAGV